MNGKRVSWFVRLVLFVIFIFCLAHMAEGQSNKQPDDKDTLQALLVEVRSLRQAMQTLQRMSLDTYRGQLMVDQIRIDRDDIRRLSAALSETRDLITRNTAAIPQGADEQKLLESQIQLEVDPNKRAQLEFELKRSKKGVELYKSQIDSLKEREQELSAELNAEKAKLDELQSRLDLLERSIENDRQKVDCDKVTPARTP